MIAASNTPFWILTGVLYAMQIAGILIVILAYRRDK